MNIQVRELLTEKNGVHNITPMVMEIIEKSGIQNGLVVVETPHSTAGVMATSFYDPKVMEDLSFEIKRLVPSRITFKHEEAPDDAAGHIKCALFGSSVTSIIQGGRPVAEDALAWFLCDYDGPRKRRFYVAVIGD